jgi:pilus assembly protein CpaC
MFVITPRLVQALVESPRVPTDNHAVPSRAEVYLNGALESATPAPAVSTPVPGTSPGAAAAPTALPPLPSAESPSIGSPDPQNTAQ